MITQEQRVKRALQILNAHGDKRVELHVRLGIGFIERKKNTKSSGRYGTLTKEQKKAAKQAFLALRKLEIALASKDLAHNLRLPLDEDPLFVWAPDENLSFAEWRKRLKGAANKPLGKPTPSKPARKYAAEAAAKLWKIAFGPERPMRTTRSGKFCQLAAALYGDEVPTAMSNYCRELLNGRRRLKPGAK